MNIFFLLIALAAVLLSGCSAVGFPGQTTVIVVTATPLPGVQATAPALTAPQAIQPTNTTAPASNPASGAAVPTAAAPSATAPGAAVPAAAPTNTLAAAVQAAPTLNVVVPATGLSAQTSVKQLLDYTLVDASGNPLGKVKDLVINRGAANSARGQISYLVAESDLKKDWLIPVPWQSVQFRPDLMAVVLPVNAAQLVNAPAFNEDFWPASFAASQATLQNFWSNPGAAAPAAPLTQAGVLQARDYISGDDLLSIDFLSPQGVKLGEIKDLAIDWQNSQPGSVQSGQVGYVILELDDNISLNKVMVPIPWRLVNPAAGQKNLVVNFTPNLLQTAPNFVEGLLPNLYAEPMNSRLNTFWSGK